MRTALVLLFLLALAALPGALLPQHPLNEAKVIAYRQQYPTLGPLLDRLGLFDIFASPWFAAIYLLLFVSLIGCLTPRCIDYAHACRARPVATPRNLARLPHHACAALDATPDEILGTVTGRLRGWRIEARDATGPDIFTVSAEKGYLREAGNLVFHLSLLGLLFALAVGKLFGYEGQVIVMADGTQFCNSAILNYDSFTAGTWVDGTALTPFCVKVDNFAANYLPNGQPEHYQADIGYQEGADLAARANGPWQPYRLAVNSPLRLSGDRVYLLGYGYAPRFTVTFPDGTTRSQAIQWKPADPTTMLSQGATKFDHSGPLDEATRRRHQIAVTGLFAPTSSGGPRVTSVYPALTNPEVAIDIYQGDLGLDDGRSQSIFEIDQRQVRSGALNRVARTNLALGRQVRLEDGTTVRFDGVKRWIDIQISHDPAQWAVLMFSVLILLGLTLSLSIKRRRFWARLRPVPVPDLAHSRHTVLEIGGLARTDQAGYGEEFDRIRSDLMPRITRDPQACGSDDQHYSSDFGGCT